MKTTAHSEYLKLQSVYLKSASDAFRSNDCLKAQWKPLNYLSQPDFSAALQEYADFEKIIEQETVTIHRFEANESVMIDSIYCRDASIITDFGVILCTEKPSSPRI